VQAWLLIIVGVLSGPLFDRGYFRSMLYVGNFLVVLGIMMLSLCKEYWQVFLAQGVCMGLGAGLLYIPSLALVSIWFDRKRALAMGVVMSGIAVGTSAHISGFKYQIVTFETDVGKQAVWSISACSTVSQSPLDFLGLYGLWAS
jgi:MFS family permease